MQEQPKLTMRERLMALLEAKYPDRARAVKNPAKLPSRLLEANSRAMVGAGMEGPSPSSAAPYSAELRLISDRSFCLSERYKAQQTRVPRAGSHPDIVEFERRFVARCRKIGVPLFAHCFLRSAAEQNKLFAAGTSKARAWESPHNFGLAVDIVHGTKAWDLTRKQWDLIGHIGKEVAAQLGLKVVWGGDWKFYDPAHWELANWRDIGSTWRDAEWKP